MYLSKLTMDMCSPEARRLLLNPYMLHKAIFRAFPDDKDGGAGRVLYRVDENKNNSIEETCLLVQSGKEPRWEKAELLTGCLNGYESKPLNPLFSPGQVFYFRLRANPTVKKFVNDKPVRRGLINEKEQLDWLKRKAENGGFRIADCIVITEGMVKDEKRTETNSFALSLLSIRFEGKLTVTAPVLFGNTLESGIGSAKGFGFGLLSIAPVRS